MKLNLLIFFSVFITSNLLDSNSTVNDSSSVSTEIWIMPKDSGVFIVNFCTLLSELSFSMLTNDPKAKKLFDETKIILSH